MVRAKLKCMVYGHAKVKTEDINLVCNASFLKSLYVQIIYFPRSDYTKPRDLRTIRATKPLPYLNYWLPETETLNTVQNTDSEQLETTNFVVSQQEVVSSIPKSLATTSYDSVDDHVTLEIARYLEKPIVLQQGKFDQLDTATVFSALKIPEALLTNALYANKVRGYAGFRATTVFTLQVNSEKFQQGRYMLTAVPCGGAYWSSKLEDSVNAHSASFVQRTMLPRVEIDLATQKACVLKLPYSSALNYYSLVAPQPTTSTWYVVRIYPYSNLEAVAGAIDARYTLWAHFEDVALIGQSIPVGLQSGSRIVTMKTNKGKSSSEKEAKESTLGPISSVSTKVSKAANVLSVVPFVGSYMTGVSWAADIVTNVAKIFGYSSPANMSEVMRVNYAINPYATNVDKFDQSMPLGFSIKNEIETLPQLSLDPYDEMSITHFVGRSCWFRSVNWLDTAVYDDLIARFNVGLYPNNTIHSIALPTVQSCPSPMQFMSLHFAKWRGSIWFRIKFVKTEFHTGRISIMFTPTHNGYVPPAVTASIQPYIYKDIVDITDLDEYTFCVPYLHPNDYISTDINGASLYGIIEIRVIDPLIHPSTVSPAVNLLMEYWGGEDMEFAQPQHKPHIYLDEIPIQLQSGIGQIPVKKNSLDPAKKCIGERIVSLRALSRKFYPVARRSQSVYPLVNAKTQQHFLPFASSHVKNGGAQPGNFADLYTDLCSMFCYSRGGVRLKATSAVDPNSPTELMLRAPGSISANVVEGYSADMGITVLTQRHVAHAIGFATFGAVSSTESLEVSVPQYAFQQARPNLLSGASEVYNYIYNVNNDANSNDSIVTIWKAKDYLTAGQADQDLGWRWYRACADDGDFSSFISIRPMLIQALF